MLLNCVFVGLGGAAGSICRYLLGLLPLKPVSGFPAITLCINIAGAFALGLIGALAGKYAKLNPQMLLFLRVGVCGGFTTFSTFSVETVVLLSHKKPDSVINVKVEFGEGEGKVPLDNIAKRAEAYKPKERVTYKMIKEYIEAKYGFKVHTAYIAEVKRALGLPMYDAPNAVEELKQPRKHPTAEKVEAIKDALKHFEVI